MSNTVYFEEREGVEEKATAAISKILSLFPLEAKEKILRIAAGYQNFFTKLSEIHLRANRYLSLTLEGINLPVHYVFSPSAVEQILKLCCENSVYAYTESLREGFVTFQGIRVGVVGRAILAEGILKGVDTVTSLVFRIPHTVVGAGDKGVELFRALGEGQGVLVYSPPGGGKTTLLSDLACQLAIGKPPKRVAIVDCRGEISGKDFPKYALVDILRDYPKAEGIEIATRTLSPEVIFCDEIGSQKEAEAILSLQNSGVPLVASAHACSFAGLMQREHIRRLVYAGVFGGFIGIVAEKGEYRYQIDTETSMTAFPKGAE